MVSFSKIHNTYYALYKLTSKTEEKNIVFLLWKALLYIVLKITLWGVLFSSLEMHAFNFFYSFPKRIIQPFVHTGPDPTPKLQAQRFHCKKNIIILKRERRREFSQIKFLSPKSLKNTPYYLNDLN